MEKTRNTMEVAITRKLVKMKHTRKRRGEWNVLKNAWNVKREAILRREWIKEVKVESWSTIESGKNDERFMIGCSSPLAPCPLYPHISPAEWRSYCHQFNSYICVFFYYLLFLFGFLFELVLSLISRRSRLW